MARAYRQALLSVAPDIAASLDRQHVDDWGQKWLTPTRTHHSLDDAVTVDVAADHIGLTVHAIYKWIDRDRITAVPSDDGRIRVRLGDAIEMMAAGRKRRAQAA